jgi:hypothetical protein
VITIRSNKASDILGTIINKSDNAPYIAKEVTIGSGDDPDVHRAKTFLHSDKALSHNAEM